MWRIKNLAVLNLHPMLNVIAEDVRDEFGIDIITSAYRPNDKGVHGFFRGLDLRLRDNVVGKRIEGWVISQYIYDPLKPDKQCALWHKTETGASHLHLQVHPNTKRRE